LGYGHRVARAGVRTAGQGTRGYLTGLTLGAKVAHHAAPRVIRRAQALGDCGLRLPVDTDGTQGFIAAMQRLMWFEEEAVAEGVLHHEPAAL